VVKKDKRVGMAKVQRRHRAAHCHSGRDFGVLGRDDA